MKFKQLQKEFPEFVAMFDGKSVENTMSFYWKRNKQSGVYEFLDADSEDEVAELMGVELCAEAEEDEEAGAEQRQLSTDEIAFFKEELSFVRSALRDSGFAKGSAAATAAAGGTDTESGDSDSDSDSSSGSE
jgi:hypothetical protein